MITAVLWLWLAAVPQVKGYMQVEPIPGNGHIITLTDQFAANVAKMQQRTDLQLKVLIEFSDMSVELAELDDARVNKVMHEHLKTIAEYVRQMKALEEK